MYIELSGTFMDLKRVKIFATIVFHHEKDHHQKGGARDLRRLKDGPPHGPWRIWTLKD
jgi:hypothetical protein